MKSLNIKHDRKQDFLESITNDVIDLHKVLFYKNSTLLCGLRLCTRNLIAHCFKEQLSKLCGVYERVQTRTLLYLSMHLIKEVCIL